ncbi:MAG: hypothetical protein IKJ69_02380 [Clostridia bacterium]|nr:hypothetical protein [Clostridia bacterium]
MKNYNEMADDVFRRRDEFAKEQKRKRKRIAISLLCLCMAVLVGVGLWQSGLFTPQVQQAEDAIYPGIKDTYGPGEEEPTQEENGVFQPAGSDTVTMENGERLTLISSYEEVSASACYALPENGKYYFSIPLNAALEEYDDKVIYRIVVRVFEDGKMLQGKDELAKIADKFFDWGYSSALEVANDQWNFAVFTMLVKEDELKKFKADNEHGYFFFLYEENDGLGDWWPTAPIEHSYFVGKVIEKYEKSSLLLVTDTGNQRFMSSDKVVVNTDIGKCPDYKAGDYLRIEFDGVVAESYPPQILGVFAVEKTDSTGKVIE